MHTYYNDAETDSAIAKAGWFRIMLRCKDGIKTALAEAYGMMTNRS